MTSPSRPDGGFTLLEILVTVAVMGLVMLLIANYAQPHSRRLDADRAALRVAAVMRQDRGVAIATGRQIQFALPPLPAWLSVVAELPPGGLVFEPDGSSSGGSIALIAPGMRSTVSTDWLTGRISIQAE